MTDAAKKILAEIEALPQADQRWLTDVLVARVPRESEEELDEAWRREIVRRLEEVDRGDAQILSADEVRRRLSAIIGD